MALSKVVDVMICNLGMQAGNANDIWWIEALCTCVCKCIHKDMPTEDHGVNVCFTHAISVLRQEQQSAYMRTLTSIALKVSSMMLALHV